MSYLFSMTELLIIGAVTLMAGSFLINNQMGLNPQRAVSESVVWGTAFFIAFAGEFILLAIAL